MWAQGRTLTRSSPAFTPGQKASLPEMGSQGHCVITVHQVQQSLSRPGQKDGPEGPTSAGSVAAAGCCQWPSVVPLCRPQEADFCPQLASFILGSWLLQLQPSHTGPTVLKDTDKCLFLSRHIFPEPQQAFFFFFYFGAALHHMTCPSPSLLARWS